MKPASILAALAAALLLPPSPAQQKPPLQALKAAAAARQKEVQTSTQINQFAGSIHSLADSRSYVNAVAAEFAGDLPPAWTTVLIRERIAQAEYRAATNPSDLIPEQRVADAWNRYVNEIGAPQDALVTVAVIHNLRDADYTTARIMWKRGIKDVWTVPNIYALDSNGNLASGCRPLEALRMLWEMANQPENLHAAQYRAQKGILASDLFRQQQSHPSGHARSEVRAYSRPEDPVEAAENRYIADHGIADFSLLVDEMIGKLLPQ